MAFKQVTRAQARKHLSKDERIAILDGTVLELETAEEFIGEITRLWQDAQRTFLTIGRYLLQAKGQLGQEGTKQWWAALEHNLPFGYNIAYQLMGAAAAIDAGRLDLGALPSSYATVYQLSTLSDAELDAARQQHPPLIRPSVTRAEVIEFKRSRQAVPNDRVLERLLKRQEKLTQELAAVTQQIQDLQNYDSQTD